MIIICIFFLFAGVLGAAVKGFDLPCEDQPISARMAVICGTSTCHMAVSGLHLLLYISFKMLKNAEFHLFLELFILG